MIARFYQIAWQAKPHQSLKLNIGFQWPSDLKCISKSRKDNIMSFKRFYWTILVKPTWSLHYHYPTISLIPESFWYQICHLDRYPIICKVMRWNISIVVLCNIYKTFCSSLVWTGLDKCQGHTLHYLFCGKLFSWVWTINWIVYSWLLSALMLRVVLGTCWSLS